MTLARPGGLAASAASENAARDEFDAVVRAHQRRIYRVLLGIVRDPDVADTLTQECFLRAYRNWKGFRGEASVGTWLGRIAIHLAFDHARNRRAEFWRRLFGGRQEEDAPAVLEVRDSRASPERQLAAREELDAVWAAAGTLPVRQRAAFHLRFGEEMTLEEIAEHMGLEVGTVKAHLSRAVAAVRERWKEKQRRER